MWVLIGYCAVICLLGFPSKAYAYLDPGTGSVMLQGVAAVFLLVGMYFRRVRAFIAKHVMTRRIEQDKE